MVSVWLTPELFGFFLQTEGRAEIHWTFELCLKVILGGERGGSLGGDFYLSYTYIMSFFTFVKQEVVYVIHNKKFKKYFYM